MVDLEKFRPSTVNEIASLVSFNMDLQSASIERQNFDFVQPCHSSAAPYAGALACFGNQNANCDTLIVYGPTPSVIHQAGLSEFSFYNTGVFGSDTLVPASFEKDFLRQFYTFLSVGRLVEQQAYDEWRHVRDRLQQWMSLCQRHPTEAALDLGTLFRTREFVNIMMQEGVKPASSIALEEDGEICLTWSGPKTMASACLLPDGSLVAYVDIEGSQNVLKLECPCSLDRAQHFSQALKSAL